MQPVIGRPMWGCQPAVAAINSVLFVSALSLSSGESLYLRRLTAADFVVSVGTIASYHLKKRPVAVKGCRNISKKDMKLNDALPNIKVDPETYRVSPLRSLLADRYLTALRAQVEADGVLCTVGPATKLPLSQNYMLF